MLLVIGVFCSIIMSTMVILFYISLFGLILLFSWKMFEFRTGSILVSKKFLRNSDSFIEKTATNILNYYNSFTYHFPKISLILIKSLINKILFYLFRFKNFIKNKILKVLKIDEEAIMSRNKGSVSFFLRNISEDKK